MIESQSIAAIVVAFAVTVIFMVSLRPIARSTGFVDRPGGRKSHVGDVPVVGGVAMFAGLVAGFSVLNGAVGIDISLLIASGLLIFVGILDDKYELPPSVRLITQIVVVLLMVFGARLMLADIGDPFGTGVITLGRGALIFTTLVVVTMINAYNFVDGMDGLSGSLALIAFLALAVVGGMDHASSVVALVASAAVFGFLLFNFPVIWNRPVRSFMGDAGSTLLGFTVVWVTLGISQGPTQLISPVICLWFASVPIYDFMTCFVRRAFAGKSPFTPGQDHFHHLLKRSGMGFRRVLGILTGLQVLYVLIALFAYRSGVPDVVMFSAWAVLGFSQRWIIHRTARRHRAMSIRRRRLKTAV